MQYRHGFDLPPGLVLPKKFCDMVVKHPANLSGFGWTEDVSVTFWFDDNTFIKTQLQRGGWPDVNCVLDIQSNAWPLPEGFADAISTVSALSNLGLIEFCGDMITSDSSKATVARFEFENLPDNAIYNGKFLNAILPNVDSMDMKTYPNKLVFFGCDGNMRGVIMGMRRKDAV
jgi:hypothetical protein